METKKNALVVDDAAEIRAAVTAILRHYGVVVSGARSIEEAETLIDSSGIAGGAFPFDLVVLDINLGARSGLDFLRSIREKMESDVPVLMISGMADSEKVQEAAKWNVSGYLLKPFTAELLWAKVSPLLAAIKKG